MMGWDVIVCTVKAGFWILLYSLYTVYNEYIRNSYKTLCFIKCWCVLDKLTKQLASQEGLVAVQFVNFRHSDILH
jgi:hypothetical protein